MRVIIFLVILCCLSIPVEAKEKPSAGKFFQDVDKTELLNQVRKFRKRSEHKIISEFIHLLSIPNVSADKKNVGKNALFIKKEMEKRGIKVQLLETPGNPVVYGELKAPGAVRTLMFYVHCDGQPVDPSKWIDSQPFKPVLRPAKMKAGTRVPKPMPLPAPGKPFAEDWRLYGRSTGDDKAPIICLLTALDAMKAAGIPLRNNIKFIFDGEEEAGSPNIGPCLKKHKLLLTSDVLFMCDGPAYFSGDPTLFFGVRGITSLEVTVYGPNISLHSGHYGNWAPNPGVRLSRLLASMEDEQGKIIVSGFYDTVVPLSSTERKAIAAVPGFEKELQELYGFCAAENPGLSLMETIQLPSLNINGLSSGWVGDQARTIVPATATASIDLRLVKGNVPADMVDKVVEHIEKQGYHVVYEEPGQDVRLKYPLLCRVRRSEKGYPASRTSMDLPISRSVADAFAGLPGLKPVMLPSLGGSLPIYLFSDILKVPVIGVSIANYDNNQHQANENIRIGHLWRGIETFAALLMMPHGMGNL
ncbi:MAG: M20/M25/M40 family metallo-hydrolase [Candidatus Aminicenantes bacterium]|nr:M20/M25/M40 family metallo-hydrolase [Candidatus Aminicenantes bacterium]